MRGYFALVTIPKKKNTCVRACVRGVTGGICDIYRHNTREVLSSTSGTDSPV